MDNFFCNKRGAGLGNLLYAFLSADFTKLLSLLSLLMFAADFGLARKYEIPAKPMTPKVVTLW